MMSSFENIKSLIAYLELKEVRVSLKEDSLKVDFKGDRLEDEILEKLKLNKPEIVAYLKALDAENNDRLIRQAPLKESYELSSSQYRLWVLCQMNGAHEAYNMPLSFELEAGIDVDVFQKAIYKVVERHEILRTVIKKDKGGTPKQWISALNESNFKVTTKDFSSFPDPGHEAHQYINTDSYKSFDLENGPLLRAVLIKIAQNKWLFYFNMHHIISDGWSLDILARDVYEFYSAIKENRTVNLPALKIHYKDYAVWQGNKSQDEFFNNQKEYWLSHLSGNIPQINLPTQLKRPNVKTFNGHSLNTFFSQEDTNKIKDFTKSNKGSLFMTLLAAWNVLMYKYTGETDIVIGTPVAGRVHPDLKDQIGFYINTLALRNKINPNHHFLAFYKELRRETLKAFENQSYPFDKLVDELDLQRDIRRSPVFDIIFTLQNTAQNDTGEDGDVKNHSEIFDQGKALSKFDLDPTFSVVSGQISFWMNYNSDVYERQMVEELMKNFKHLLIVLIESPEAKIEHVEFISAQEKELQLNRYNETLFSAKTEGNIVDLIKEQVLKSPENIAVVFEETRLNYKELWELSDELAYYLVKEKNVEKGDFVSIKLERSEWIVIGILSVLKIGAAYVPIDLAYPDDRIRFIEKDVNSKITLDETLLETFSGYTKQIEANTLESIQHNLNDLAYIIYTSGSTGKPKGVMVEHQSIVNLISYQTEYFNISAEERILLFSSISFDASVEQLFLALLNGAQLHIASKELLLNEQEFNNMLNQEKITHIHAVPSFFQNIVIGKGGALRRIVSGGDVFDDSILHKYKGAKVYNEYGPTETTVTSVIRQVNSANENRIIGQPIGNTDVFILSEANQLLPTGVIGELCIGGKGVSRGYLNRPDLTAEKFIDHPFKDAGKIYKTGDLARWLPNGEIEFLGRKDNQVKIRGYRIELDEIEVVLSEFKGIAESVLTIDETNQADKKIAAFIRCSETINLSALNTYMKSKLPSYMLPVKYINVQKFPLGPSGKIDKKKLLASKGHETLNDTAYHEAETAIEKELVEIWKTLLGEDRIGLESDFFALGGHSLKAIKLSTKCNDKFGVKITLSDIFLNPLLKDQANFITNAAGSLSGKIQNVQLSSDYAVSAAQRRMWLLSQETESSIAYNMSASVELKGTYDVDLFLKAIESVIDRHEVLRTVFKMDHDQNLRQVIVPFDMYESAVGFEDLSNCNSPYTEVQKQIENASYVPFDLDHGPLLKATLYLVEKGHYVLYYNMHHIICDGWSMNVLEREVFEIYDALANNRMPKLDELRIQYKDFAQWELEQTTDEEISEHRQYWLNEFSGEIPQFKLLPSIVRPAVKTNSGYYLSTNISSDLSTRLEKFCADNGGSLFMGILSTVSVLFYRYTLQNEVVIGSPIAGRFNEELENQIGCYVNTIAQKYAVYESDSFTQVFERIKEKTIRSFSHQQYQFDRMVEDLNLKRETSRSALFDVMVNLENTTEVDRFSENIDFNKIKDLGSGTSQFDLDLTFEKIDDYLSLVVNFNPDIYPKEIMEGLMLNYKVLLDELLKNETKNVLDLPLLHQEEESRLLELKGVDFVKRSSNSLLDLINESTVKYANNVAIECKGEKLTYRDLGYLSDQFANYLMHEHKLGINKVVGLELDRNEWMIIAILAVWKCNCAYLPIDSTYPDERRAYLKADASIEVCISPGLIEEFKKENNSNIESGAQRVPEKNDLAYVIYTSGSTGQPKGVMVEHRSVLDYAQSFCEYFELSETDRIIQQASFSFDTHVEEVFPALLAGARILLSSNGGGDIQELTELIENRGATVISSTPLVLEELNRKLSSACALRLVISGGDKFHAKIASNIIGECLVYDTYGPTECTVCATYSKIDSIDQKNEIGRPITNRHLYLLNDKLQLQPMGASGEICIAGEGVARGYLNNKEESNKKFVSNPFSKDEVLYRTGDIGYWDTKGNLIFIGRKDKQVKIRGYRVELSEVEFALLKITEITRAEVLVRKGQFDANELVVCYTSDALLEPEDIRRSLRSCLPDYSIPVEYYRLSEFPETLNHKIDRVKLLELVNDSNEKSQKIVLPTSETEKRLLSIWQQLLNKEKISVLDDFFALGGQSLKAFKLIREIEKEFGIKLKIKEVFEFSTIKQTSEFLELKESTREPEIVNNTEREEIDL